MAFKVVYTVKVKEKHNPPVFNEKLGDTPGVVAIHTDTYSDETLKKISKRRIAFRICDQMTELLEEYFEVVVHTEEVE